MDGTLSYEYFHRLALDLLQRSERLGDTWELKTAAVSKPTHTPQQYLVKKSTQVIRRVHHGGGEDDDELGGLAGDLSGLGESSDTACLDGSAGGSCCGEDCLVHVEYHIVRSVSYQVPVLYFNATFSNGQALALEDVWQLLASELVCQDVDKWGLLTQQEHPYLGRPFYHIHPCHTAAVMGKAMQCVEGSEGGEGRTAGNYLITWLSTFAPVIGLELSLQYAMKDIHKP